MTNQELVDHARKLEDRLARAETKITYASARLVKALSDHEENGVAADQRQDLIAMHEALKILWEEPW